MKEKAWITWKPMIIGHVNFLFYFVYNKKMERENIYIESLRLDLLSLLIELEDPENIEEESDSDSDSENCLRSMLKTTQEHLQMDEQNIIVNTIYILKNQAVTTFFGIVKFFFNMASF